MLNIAGLLSGQMLAQCLLMVWKLASWAVHDVDDYGEPISALFFSFTAFYPNFLRMKM